MNRKLVVETLEKKREPMPTMEAVYLITPAQESLNLLMADFKPGKALYKAAHVYTTQAIPEELFKTLSKSEATKRFKSLVEVNISFTPCESKVVILEELKLSCDCRCTTWVWRIATRCCTARPPPPAWPRRWRSNSPRSAVRWGSSPPSDTPRK